MMPRLFCLTIVLACAGCAMRGGLPVTGQSQGTAPNTADAERDDGGLKRSSDVQLTTLQTVATTGERYDDQLIEADGNPIPLRPVTDAEIAVGETLTSDHIPPGPAPGDAIPVAVEPAESIPLVQQGVSEINLPTALAMIGGQHPAVGMAQWRVREAYARLDQARVLWLPTIQAGISFHRHDGNYQASDGAIIDVDRSSLQYGLGMGATGAGTTMRPGLIARFRVADAIFEPKVKRNEAWAQSHAASATLNRQLLQSAVAYIDLVNSHQRRSVMERSRQRISELAKLTSDFAQTGQGLQADADRLQTERMLVENRTLYAHQQIAIASAQLAEALNANPTKQFVPLDPTIVPIQMIDPGMDSTRLIMTGLSHRPELKQAGAMVVAACDAYRREKCDPYLPSVILGFSTGGFGGGLGNTIDDVDGRYDFDALLSWDVRNLGLGEQAARRESGARIRQAKFAKIQLMDRVAREINEARAKIEFRQQQISVSQRAIQSAEDSYQRNLTRIRDGQGLPLEALQSIQALEASRLAYLDAVVDFNKAQFQLQWALGWPVSAPADASLN